MRAPRDERARLLYGPYQAPALRKGDRAFCLYRDCEVVITSWTDARMSWPRGRGSHHGRFGGPGLLVNEELARAIRQESGIALRHWWGVSESLVWKWRQALGVPRLNEGSKRLRDDLNRELAADLSGVPLPPEEIERRRRMARELMLARYLKTGRSGPLWAAEEVALLGRVSDEVAARQIGRSPNAVRQKRESLGIPRALA
jgi:hypothetical protein